MYVRFLAGIILVFFSLVVSIMPTFYLGPNHQAYHAFLVIAYFIFAIGIYLTLNQFKSYFADIKKGWSVTFISGSVFIILSVMLGFYPSYLLVIGIYNINPLPIWIISFLVLAGGFVLASKPFLELEKIKERIRS